jgi:hypothetical protein
VHLVAAFAHQTRVALAQAETLGKGHELEGVQAVLAALPARLLSGRVVTGDALLATHGLCRQIVRKAGTISHIPHSDSGLFGITGIGHKRSRRQTL